MSRPRVHEVCPGCRSAGGDLCGGVSACHSGRKRGCVQLQPRCGSILVQGVFREPFKPSLVVFCSMKLE
eukprot:6461404-Amphidinium_carterae.1